MEDTKAPQVFNHDTKEKNFVDFAQCSFTYSTVRLVWVHQFKHVKLTVGF